MVFAKANASSHLTPVRVHRSLHAGLSKSAACATVLCICLFAAGSGGVPLLAANGSGEKPTAPAPTDEGFTRESMAELGRPEPAPAPSGPIISPRIVRPEVDSKDFVPRRHPQVRRVRPVSTHSRLAAVQAHPNRRRNPVVSFVYWWNGLVIRKFHTRFGTVLLGTVGAKT